jgi:hypothetical protein
MTLSITNLANVTQADFNAAYSLIVQMLASAYPGIDPKRGALSDLLLDAEASLQAANQENIDLALQSSSILAISANPALADPTTLANLASNFFVTPSPAVAATGTVTVVISVLVQTAIAQGAVFTDAFGNTYTANAAVVARTTLGAVTGPNDQLLLALGNGNYSFPVAVTATQTGPAGNLAYLSALTPAAPPPNFVSAYAAADFSGGAAADTTTTLLAKISTGFAVRSLASRGSIDGLVKTVTGYSTAFTSTAGYGDPEQIRYHSILPVAFGGRLDVWVRPPGLYVTLSVVKTALLVSTSGGHGVWQFSLGRDDMPGFYQLSAITQTTNPSAPGYTVTQETRGYDLSPGTTARALFLPDIASAVDAAYSAYQTDVVQFIDTDTPLAGLVVGVSTRNYLVAVLALPSIAVVQELVAGRTLRSPAADCLVRAAVPCFVTVAVTVSYQTGSTVPTAGTVQSAAATAVNATGFIGSLTSGLVTQAIQAAIPTTAWVSSFTMTGQIRRPDGTTVPLTGPTLTLPNDPSNLVSARTCCFFLPPASVTVTLTAVATPSP